MADLTTMGAWKRAFYRLTNTSSTDDALTEFDDSSEEGVETALQVGLDRAQEFLLAAGLQGWFVTRSSALSFSGTDAADGGKYATLPSDFKRLACDHGKSCLVGADGDTWGVLLAWHQRNHRGDGYYLKDGKLWLARTASPPATLYMEYVPRLELPADDTTAFSSFPNYALALIPAFAAEYAMDEEWLPGGDELRNKIQNRLIRARQEAHWALRMFQGPRRMKSSPVLGNHFWG